MGKITTEELRQYVEENIPDFHQRRLKNLSKLQLKKVLRRKNPYLFKAKNVTTAGDLVKGILEAHLSSQEETIFGDFLEGLAVFICNKIYGGWKSGITGVDLELEKDGVRYIINIKSGPNWGNSRQISKMRQDFNEAKKTLRTSGSNLRIEAINGCCYGRSAKEDRGDYFKLCGEVFWTFISGKDNLYTEMIEPIGHQAKQRNDEFYEEYVKVANIFTKQFIDEFCFSDGGIDWAKLTRFASSRDKKY